MINLTPLPTYSITFIVDDGTYPVEGAEIEINTEIIATNADGEAVFTDMDPGTYYYTVSIQGYIADDGVVIVVDEDMVVEVTLLTTGIVELEKEIKIYPNPSIGIVNIENSKGSTVYVVNLTGAVVYSSELDNDKFTINISNHPAGLYMIQLVSGSETKIIKHILQK